MQKILYNAIVNTISARSGHHNNACNNHFSEDLKNVLTKYGAKVPYAYTTNKSKPVPEDMQKFLVEATIKVRYV